MDYHLRQSEEPATARTKVLLVGLVAHHDFRHWQSIVGSGSDLGLGGHHQHRGDEPLQNIFDLAVVERVLLGRTDDPHGVESLGSLHAPAGGHLGRGFVDCSGSTDLGDSAVVDSYSVDRVGNMHSY